MKVVYPDHVSERKIKRRMPIGSSSLQADSTITTKPAETGALTRKGETPVEGLGLTRFCATIRFASARGADDVEQTQDIPATDLDLVRLLAALAPTGAVVDRQDLLQELGRTGMDPDGVLASLERLGAAGMVAVSEMESPTGGRLQVAVVESALAGLDPTPGRSLRD